MRVQYLFVHCVIALFVVLSVAVHAQQGSFIIANKSNETHTYFVVNGTSGTIGIATANLDTRLKVNGSINITDTIWSLGLNLTSFDTSAADDFSGENFTNSSTINITISNGKVRLDLNISLALCIALTGSSALCDGNDEGGSGAVSGSGNSGNITYWTGSATVGNSTLYQSNGLIGIGTTSPAYLLQVGNTSNAINLSGIFYINGSSGNVGIGTSGPRSKLYLEDSASTPLTIDTTSAFGSFLSVRTSATSRAFFGYNAVSGNIAILDSEGLTERLGITTSGNVGIGTTSPTYLLQVGNAMSAVNLSGILYINGTNGTVSIGATGPSVTGAARTLEIYSNVSETPSGLVLAGDSNSGSPVGRISFFNANPAASGEFARIDAAPHTYTQDGQLRFYTRDFVNGLTQRMVIDRIGNVGIGTDDPVNKLDVAGNGNFTGNVTVHDFKITCPANVTSNFTSIESRGRQLGCIQTHEHKSGNKTWFNAEDECFTSYGGRLPSQAEWYSAMNNYALLNETDDFEWVTDASFIQNVVIGSGSITNNYIALSSDLYPFRCWIPS